MNLSSFFLRPSFRRPCHRKCVLWSWRQPRQAGMEVAPGRDAPPLSDPDPLRKGGDAEHVGGRAQRARDICHHPEGAEGKNSTAPARSSLGGRLRIPEVKRLRRQRGGAGGPEGKPADGGRAGRPQIPHGDRRGAAALRHLQLGSQPDQHRLQSGKRQHPPSATTASTWCRRNRGAGKNPNRVPARETRATTAAERRLLRRRPGRALRRA